MSAINSTTAKIHYGLDCGELISSKVEVFDKISKITYRTIDFTRNCLDYIPETLGLLSARLKSYTPVVDITRFITTANFLLTPKNGIYIFEDVAVTWQRCAEKVILLAHQLFKMTTVLVAWNLVDVGRLAINICGSLNTLTLVTETLIAISSVFGTWDGLLTIRKINENEDNETHSKVALASKAPINEEHSADDKKISAKIVSIKKFDPATDRFSAWLRVALAAGKIVLPIIFLALSAVSLNFTAPYCLLIIGGGICYDSIGITKIFYDDWCSSRNLSLPKSPS